MPRKRKQVEEEEGVTRCVCGHEELQSYAAKQRGVDPSLFIQCEQCEVWQHGYCVGLAARDVPEVYYCEECQPEFHDVKTKNGRTTSRYTPQARQPAAQAQRRDQSSESDGEEDSQPRDRRKRRQTMNSREDDILRRVLEQSAREAELLKRGKLPRLESDSVSDQEQEQDQDQEEAQEKSDGDNEAEDPKQQGERANSSVEAGTETDADAENENENENEVEVEVEAEVDAKQLEKHQHEHESGVQAKEEENDDEQEEKQPTPPPKRKRRPRGRPGPKVGKNAPNAATSKKCKPKIPSARATFTEMRKRVAMILEFSGHTQSEMISEDEFRKNMLQEQKSLENNEPVVQQVETLYSQLKQNSSQLEGLTAKLLAWQEKYG